MGYSFPPFSEFSPFFSRLTRVRNNVKLGGVLLRSFLFSFVLGVGVLVAIGGDDIAGSVGSMGVVALTLILFFTHRKRYFGKPKNREKVLEYARYREEAIASKGVVRQLMEKRTADLKRLISRMENDAVCCIPQYYWNDANTLFWYLQNKRARTLTESINLLEQEKREEKILEYQRRQARASEIAAYNAQIAAQNTEAAARSANAAAVAAGIGATFSVLSYLKRD